MSKTTRDGAVSAALNALRPLYDAVFNDNGDITVNGPYPYDEAVAGYFAYKRLSALEPQQEEAVAPSADFIAVYSAAGLPPAYGGCTCSCHRVPGIIHMTACCRPGKDRLNLEITKEWFERQSKLEEGVDVSVGTHPTPAQKVQESQTVSEEVLSEAAEVFAAAYAVYPGGEPKTHISDWFDLDAQDAVDFGVLKTPEWHGYSDIRAMEYEAYIAAVIREPMRAALKAALERTP